MKRNKLIILLIVGLVSIVIPVFLKLFSSNVFKVPVIAEQPVIAACNMDMMDELVNKIDIVFIKNAPCEDATCTAELDQLKRVAQRYPPSDELNYTVMTNAPFELIWRQGDISVVHIPTLLNNGCINEPIPEVGLLLFDQQNNLRGIFEARREEVDRLMIELEILMKYK